MHLSTKTSFLALLYCLYALGIQAQTGSQPSSTTQSPPLAKDSLAMRSGLNTALRTYHAALTPETELYRGSQYADYTFLIAKGHPYFELDSMLEGSVVYNGILYEKVLLKLDLVKDLLVTNDPYDFYKINLITEQIDRFSIGDHLFIHLSDSLNHTAPHTGFYELLYKGRNTLLKKEKKVIWDDLSSPNEGNRRYITDEVSYYIRKGDTYYSVNNKGSLLYALKDKGKEAKKFMRSNGLNIRTDKENTLLKVIAWYDGLNQ